MASTVPLVPNDVPQPPDVEPPVPTPDATSSKSPAKAPVQRTKVRKDLYESDSTWISGSDSDDTTDLPDHLQGFHENIRDVRRDASRAAFSQQGANTLLLREQHRGALEMRSRQASLHQSLTLARIDALERGLRKLHTDVYKLDEKLEVPNPSNIKTPVHLHELRRSDANQFRLNQDIVTLPTLRQPALESLMPDAHFVKYSDDEKHNADRAFIPEALRIRSHVLLMHLRKCTRNAVVGQETSSKFDGVRVYGGVVFLRPFKMFIESYSDIKNSVGDVEVRVQKSLEEKANDVDETDPDRALYDVQDLLKDLKLLVEFLDVDLKPMFDLRQRLRDGTAAEIEYPDLWHLFNRGEMVLTRENKAHANVVVNTVGGREHRVNHVNNNHNYNVVPYGVPPGRAPPKPRPVGDGFGVEYISIGCDGSAYVPRLHRTVIRRFYGSQPISQLPVYPLHYASNADDLRSLFKRRGRKFLDVTRKPFVHQTVQGRTVDEPSHDIDAQAIVDMSLAINFRPEWKLKQDLRASDLIPSDRRETTGEHWCQHRHAHGRVLAEGCCGSDVTSQDLEYDDRATHRFLRDMARLMGPSRSYDLEEDDLMLMRPFVHAFVLRSRQWVTVRIDDLYNVDFNNNFKDLVLPESHKTTVKALVETHEKNSHTVAANRQTPAASIGESLDLVKGKGQGLIILLHGPPGVGKTSTAECVADDTKRPLFSITCGDIGETAADVEFNLQKNFQLAYKWGCVLLLDEADIFLAKRTRHDLHHNAVTSVFLRSLEYYAGILFLTSNRVGAIDPAFKSRIQVALFYPSLDLDVTVELYKKFIRRARDAQEKSQSQLFKIKDKEIIKFAKHHFRGAIKHKRPTWNGRQIRNAFQTAIALAEHDALSKPEEGDIPILGKNYFEVVASGYKQFDEYLILTLGENEGDAAKREGVRDDGFLQPEVNMPVSPPLTNRRSSRGHRRSRSSKKATRVSESDSTTSSSDSDSGSEGSETGKKGKEPAEKELDTVTQAGRSAELAAKEVKEMEEFRQFMEWKKMKS